MVTTNISIREWQDKVKEVGIRNFPRPFIVCPECGNKRCPHATDRKYECTNSNETGQPGSAYA